MEKALSVSVSPVLLVAGETLSQRSVVGLAGVFLPPVWILAVGHDGQVPTFAAGILPFKLDVLGFVCAPGQGTQNGAPVFHKLRCNLRLG